MIEDIEKFTIDNVNKISLTLLDDAGLREKHLDNFLIFILGAFKDEPDCLSKLKVLDKGKINTDQPQDVASQIFLTVLSIKGVRLAKDIEHTSLYLCVAHNKKIFNRIVKWYFTRREASPRFVGSICDEIRKIRDTDHLEEADASGEGGDTEEAGNSEDSDTEEHTQDSTGMVPVNRKDKRRKEQILLDKLVVLLDIVVKKTRCGIRDFCAMTTLLRIRHADIARIVRTYVKKINDDGKLQALFFDTLRQSPLLMLVFPQVHQKISDFDWDAFIDIVKDKRRADLGCLRFVDVPFAALKRIAHEVKRNDEVLKTHIKKMSLDELRCLGAVADSKISDAIASKIKSLQSAAKAAEGAK